MKERLGLAPSAFSFPNSLYAQHSFRPAMSEDTTAAAGPSTVSPSSNNSLPPHPPNLPPKPEDNHHEGNNDNTDNPDSLVILDSSNSEEQSVCVICEKNVAIYTCPRCSTRTCSLICSTGHKTRGEGCSGIRNKAAYVPMNQYGYMALMDDYVYLEDVGRKVGEWGKEIVQGGYSSNNGNSNGYHNSSIQQSLGKLSKESPLK